MLRTWRRFAAALASVALALPVLETGIRPAAAVSPGDPDVAVAVHPGGGWWLASARGAVTPEAGAPVFGSLAGIALARPIVGMAATATGRGYWLVASDGGVFSFGDARFLGSTGGVRLVRPIVG
ncbi:MAG TPA: hypothetical protein VKI19_09570, partial [Acidimicrobiales bacterium]|nr:hypothetical protein [Acidimicrobiales bacterium]